MESIASSYPLVVDSNKIMIDDLMVMVYWRGALEVPFGKSQDMQMGTAVEGAISELENVFPPPRLKSKDVCDPHFEEVLDRHGVGNCSVYHVARWVAIGQRGVKDTLLSRDLLSGFSQHDIMGNVEPEDNISVQGIVCTMFLVLHHVIYFIALLVGN